MTRLELLLLRIFAITEGRTVYAIRLEVAPGQWSIEYISTPLREAAPIIQDLATEVAACEPGGQIFTCN